MWSPSAMVSGDAGIVRGRRGGQIVAPSRSSQSGWQRVRLYQVVAADHLDIGRPVGMAWTSRKAGLGVAGLGVGRSRRTFLVQLFSDDSGGIYADRRQQRLGCARSASNKPRAC